MKNNLIVTVLTALLLVMVAGCASGPVSPSNTPGPNGQINVPPVKIEINQPAMSIPVNLPGPNSLVNTPGARGSVSSILMGIWHGVISPVTLVISFVNPDVQMYDVHNDGSPYNLGFLLGVAIVFLLLGSFFGSRRR